MRLMKIRYPYREELKDRLHSCLEMCSIPHVIYDDVFQYVIYIDKGKCTWKQVMQEINKVHSAKFEYKNGMYIKDGKVCVDCGTICI